MEDKTNKITKLIFFKKHWLSIFIILACLITTGSLVYIFNSYQPQPDTSANIIPKKKPQPKYYTSLAGYETTNQQEVNQPITAIMIENSPAARPQSGLGQAEVVFEAVTEGGITRFMALFQKNKPQLIGPIRSVRTHFVDLLTPFNASIAHVGGSRSALNTIRNGNYRDIDQFFNAKYYWRSNDRYAPHNMYSSFAKLDQLNKSKKYTTSKALPLLRNTKKDKKKPSTKPDQPEKLIKKININFSSSLFNTYYLYNEKTDDYTRYLNGKIHQDRENGPIKPKVVVALMTTMRPIAQDGSHAQVKALGSGKAYVFQNGKVITGSWSKPNKHEQIKLLDSAGKPIKLNPGMTWISLVTKELGSVNW